MLLKLDKPKNRGENMIAKLEETTGRTRTEMVKSGCLWGINRMAG